MKNTKKFQDWLIIIILLLFLNIILYLHYDVFNSFESNNQTKSNNASVFLKLSSPHDPISISGNTDFANKAISEGWSGDGTAGNPYIIKDYIIDASSSHGIYIVSTDVYFIIENVFVSNGHSSYSGIMLYIVENGLLRNNTANNNDDGFYLKYSDNNILINNIATNNQNGFSLSESSYNTITNNSASNNQDNGVLFYYSSSNTLKDNIVNHNQYGIYLSDSDSNNIAENSGNYNQYGMYLYSSDNNIISDNILMNNEIDCIYETSGSIDNDISGNTCHTLELEWNNIWIWVLIIIIIIFSFSVITVKTKAITKIKEKLKQIKKEQDLKANKFEDLIRNSKELINKGTELYSKKKYEAAIEKWKDAIDKYEFASKKALSSSEKAKIKDNIKILRESIFNAHKGRANTHNNNGLKAYEKSDLQIAQKELRLAISSFQSAIDLNKDEKLNFSSNSLQKAIKNTEIRLKQLGFEMTILDADNQLKEARSLQKKDLRKAIKMVNDIILKYSEAKEKANKNMLFKPLSKTLETKIIKCRDFQHRLQDKMDQLIGITPISNKIKVDEIDIIDYKSPLVIEEDRKKTLLSIVREFEFIGGQIRIKVGLINKTNFTFTNLKIAFNIPDALKWILHEPGYERKGDSLLISKLGAKEKKAISLYLEPINCMESAINATISFFDVRDKPHALTMNPKMISISCPIFFTEVDANLARVKSLRRKLAHHDKKIFPLIKSEESLSIFSSILTVLNKFDIKLIFKVFSEEDRFGEAWFYGITKVKKNQFVIYVLLDGTDKKVEIEVSGNDEPQITAFLAEIGDRTRKQLIHDKIIDIEDNFYDMRVSILSKLCPYCYTSISSDLVQKFVDGILIQCKNCNVVLKINEK